VPAHVPRRQGRGEALTRVTAAPGRPLHGVGAMQEKLSGVVVVQSKSDMSHGGITLTVEGMVNMQLSSKSVGVFEAFYNSIRPVQLLYYTLDVAGPGKLPGGTTELPFEVPLKAKEGQQLYETYKGVFVNIEYSIKVDMQRSLLNKSLSKRIEFFIESEVRGRREGNARRAPRGGGGGAHQRSDAAVTEARGPVQSLKDPPKPVEVPFTITPESLQTAKRPTVRTARRRRRGARGRRCLLAFSGGHIPLGAHRRRRCPTSRSRASCTRRRARSPCRSRASSPWSTAT